MKIKNPEIGKEYPEKNESHYFPKIVNLFKKSLTKTYQQGEFKRMFHPKMHGLVKAQFIIPDNLPAHLKIGLFEKPSRYDAWVRFSNANKFPEKDWQKNLRGMAIKLMGVEGVKLLAHEKKTKTFDFLLASYPTLQIGSVKDTYHFMKAFTSPVLIFIWYSLTHPRKTLHSIRQFSLCNNLFSEKYYSMGAFKFGAVKAVKYAVFPNSETSDKQIDKNDENFLNTRLVRDLKNKEMKMDFMIQFQEDPKKMPVEDPRVEWKSTYHKIAEIRFPIQQFNSSSQREYGENLSFTPWHCIEPHKPLGAPNRTRKFVYEAISEFRRAQNGITILDEPEGFYSFAENQKKEHEEQSTLY